MSCQDLLSPWVIYRLFPTLKHSPIARFRRRNDAEAYLKVVTRMIPQAEFAIAFEPQLTPDPKFPIPDANIAEHASMID